MTDTESQCEDANGLNSVLLPPSQCHSLLFYIVHFTCPHCHKSIGAPNALVKKLHFEMCRAVVEEGNDSINCILRSHGLLFLHYQNDHKI